MSSVVESVAGYGTSSEYDFHNADLEELDGTERASRTQGRIILIFKRAALEDTNTTVSTGRNTKHCIGLVPLD